MRLDFSIQTCRSISHLSIEETEEEMEKLRAEVVYNDLESGVLEEKLKDLKKQITQLKYKINEFNEMKTRSLNNLSVCCKHYDSLIYSNKEGA